MSEACIDDRSVQPQIIHADSVPLSSGCNQIEWVRSSLCSTFGRSTTNYRFASPYWLAFWITRSSVHWRRRDRANRLKSGGRRRLRRFRGQRDRKFRHRLHSGVSPTSSFPPRSSSSSCGCLHASGPSRSTRRLACLTPRSPDRIQTCAESPSVGFKCSTCRPCCKPSAEPRPPAPTSRRGLSARSTLA